MESRKQDGLRGLYFALAAALTLPASPALHAAEAAEAGNEIEEVLVTSRRREESMQDVPISITALGGAALESRGITSSFGLSGLVPNLQIKTTNAGPNQSNIRLRGIPGVSVYVDGIAHSNIVGQIMSVVDIDRVEVLQGPQGTLFGKNAIGGAIQYITTKPSDEAGGSARFAFGSFQRVDASGTLNVPWTDTFYTKFTGASVGSNGFVHNVIDGEWEGADRSNVARVDNLWKPNDKFEARLVFYYTGETTNQLANVNLKNNLVCRGDPVPPFYTGRFPGPLCVLNTIGIKVDPTLNFGAQGLWQSSSNAKGPAGYDYKSYDYALDLGYTLSDNWSVRSLTGYRDFKFQKLADHDSVPTAYLINTTAGLSTEKTQELQLAFNSPRISGTTGLYYYKSYFRRASISSNYSDLSTPALVAASAALGGRTPSLNQNMFDNYIKGWAAFSEWSAKATDKFSVTLGARYTSEDNDTILYPPPVIAGACCSRLPFNLIPAGPQLVPTRSATFTNFTPRLSLEYRWAPEVMTYLTYSKGFNAGGFNTATGVPIPFKPETLDSYELGWKSDLLNRRLRLNAALYYGKYKDIQVQVNTPFGQTVVLATINAGAGEVKGFETQGTWLATDHLSFDFGVGLLRTKYTDTGGAVGFTENTPFAFSPKMTYNVAAQYQWNLANADSLTLRGDYTFAGDTKTNIDPVFAIDLRGYGLLNGRLSYQKPDAKWNVAVYGTNLLNKFYLQNGLNITQEGWAFGEAGRPRELGVAFNIKF
jgi:iron complex outermembrane receptor protein